MKDLAKRMVKARVPVKRTKPRKLADIAREQGTGDTERSTEHLPDHSVYKPLDSWEVRNRDDIKKKVEEEEARAKAEPDPKEVPETYSGRRMNPRKRRRSSMSISVSEEEEELLRRYAASKNMNFSAWARGLLFKAMGRKPPARPRRE